MLVVTVAVVHPEGRSTRDEGIVEESKDNFCEPNVASQLAGAPTIPTTTTTISAALVSVMTILFSKIEITRLDEGL